MKWSVHCIRTTKIAQKCLEVFDELEDIQLFLVETPNDFWMKYVDIILRTLLSMCYFDMKKVRYDKPVEDRRFVYR